MLVVPEAWDSEAQPNQVSEVAVITASGSDDCTKASDGRRLVSLPQVEGHASRGITWEVAQPGRAGRHAHREIQGVKSLAGLGLRADHAVGPVHDQAPDQVAPRPGRDNPIGHAAEVD